MIVTWPIEEHIESLIVQAIALKTLLDYKTQTTVATPKLIRINSKALARIKRRELLLSTIEASLKLDQVNNSRGVQLQ